LSRFRFSLDRVLSWRQTNLSIEEADLSRLRQQMIAIEMAVSNLADRSDREAEALRARKVFTGDDVMDLARTREWISKEGIRLHSAMADCTRAIERRTAAVTEARRQVRLLEKLRDRRQAGWRAETDRQLEELAGESAVAGWRRQNS
jgi:hypothetical protein